MSDKAMRISAAIYTLNAVIWTINFFLHWYRDGMLKVSTALFGISTVCFIIAAAGALLALHRRKKNTKEVK